MDSVDENYQLTLLQQLLELERENGLAAYQPHAKQMQFHAAGEYKRRYLRTGNRFGKSTCGAAEDVAWAVGARLWLPPEHPAYQAGIPRRSTKGLIICADWDKAREIFTAQQEGQGQGKLFKMLPKNALAGVHKNQAGEIDCISVTSMWGGTSTIYLDTVKSFKSNPLGQESSDWDWIHVDEPCPKPMWEANARGLVDRDGSAWFTCTPLQEQWINEMFIGRKRLREDFENALEDKQHSKWVLTGSSYDNTTIERAAIDRFMNDLSAEDRAARLYGRPKTQAGAVYSQFDPARHVYYEKPKGWLDFDRPPDNYTIRVAIDPHPRTPHAVLFAATAPTGQVFFYQEYFQHVMLDDLCLAILELLNGRVPHQIICDPIAFNADPISGAMWADTFWKHGLNVVPAPKELSHGIVVSQQALAKPDYLYFSSALAETLYEFDVYVWDQKKANKPVDANDHMMENFYRFNIVGLDYVPLEGDYVGKTSDPFTLSATHSLMREVNSTTNFRAA